MAKKAKEVEIVQIIDEKTDSLIKEFYFNDYVEADKAAEMVDKTKGMYSFRTWDMVYSTAKASDIKGYLKHSAEWDIERVRGAFKDYHKNKLKKLKKKIFGV